MNSYVSLSGENWEAEPYQELRQNPENIIIDQENAIQMEKKIRQQLSKFENQVLELVSGWGKLSGNRPSFGEDTEINR